MMKNAGRALLALGGLFALGACVYFVVRVRAGGDAGDLVTVEPPPGYQMAVRSQSPYDHSWNLRKTETAYAVKSTITLWAESPVTRLIQTPTVNTLMGGYKARTAQSVQKNPQRIVVNRNKQVTLNGTVFTGYQTQEARSDALVVTHYAAFEVRGRHYNCDAVFRFADKRLDPAKVKITEAEWKKLLSSIH